MKPASDEALRGLREYRKAESTAYNDNDLRMIDNFHEDIVLTSNGVPTLVGRDAVREFFGNVWAENRTRFVEVVDEKTTEFGDLLFISGRFTLEVTSKATGETVLDHGRFQGVLYKGEDGRYQLLREACMDCVPPPGESDELDDG